MRLFAGRPEWMAQAACKGMTSLFFTDEDTFRSTPAENERTRRAKVVCWGCPVRLECLEFACRTSEPMGVWGGATPRERQEWRRSGKPPAPPGAPVRAPRPAAVSEPTPRRLRPVASVPVASEPKPAPKPEPKPVPAPPPAPPGVPVRRSRRTTPKGRFQLPRLGPRVRVRRASPFTLRDR